MRQIIYIENESHERPRFGACILLLLAAALRILIARLRGELFIQSGTRPARSYLDVMRASRIPMIRVTLSTCIIVNQTHSANGLEITIWQRGRARTWRAGRREAFIASRTDYLSHYGANSL